MGNPIISLPAEQLPEQRPPSATPEPGCKRNHTVHVGPVFLQRSDRCLHLTHAEREGKKHLSSHWRALCETLYSRARGVRSVFPQPLAPRRFFAQYPPARSEEHTSELQSP